MYCTGLSPVQVDLQADRAQVLDEDAKKSQTTGACPAHMPWSKKKKREVGAAGVRRLRHTAGLHEDGMSGDGELLRGGLVVHKSPRELDVGCVAHVGVERRYPT